MDKTEYKQLSEMSANGDTKSFARLYETVYREMYYTAYYTLRDDADAVHAVTESIRSTFSAIGKLKSETAFRTYIMKHLCACIKIRLKQYAAESTSAASDSDSMIKQEFASLPDTERLVAALYTGGRFVPEEISHFTGLSTATVRKKLDRAMSGFALD